jgi:hypothetical protein
MKTLISTFLFALLSIGLMAQAPQAIKYQAIFRDNAGNIVPNQSANFRITIHKAEMKLIVYQEIHLATSNDYGLVNLDIGYGTPVFGSISAIDWGNGSYMIEMEADSNLGDEYSSFGSSSILSVPYSLYAKTAGNGGGGTSLWEQNEDDIFYLDGNVGIGTDMPEFKLSLGDDGGILAKGGINSGAILASSGYGSKMIWYPRKAAFRAGYQVGSEWNDAMIGKYSIALGSTVEASGDYSFAVGWSNIASGPSSIALGQLAEAGAQDAIAIGNSVEANGSYAMAIGQASTAGNDYSATFGRYLKASADGAMVIGSGAHSFAQLENSIANSLMIGFSEAPTMMINSERVGIGTTSFNTNYTLQVKATSGTYAIIGEGTGLGGVYGYSTNANGVLGFSTSSNGVYGYSSESVGVRAVSMSGTAFHAENFGAGATANLIGKATGSEDAVLVTENTNGGIAAKFITSSSSPALIIDQGSIGSMIRGYSLISDEHVLDIAGNGRITLFNSDHTQTISINPYESGTSDGGIINLYNGNGTRTLALDASETGTTDGSQITLYNAAGAATIAIDGNHQNGEGWITTNVLEITGGSDVAEPFDINSDAEVLPGMVVSIDPDHAGKLKVSAQAYDKCVAGIVSGAEGINAGLLLSQKGTIAEGEYPVALSGRVYCLATADNGSIKPGDLLTTSDTEGHVMRADDNEKMQGAIVGKAMMGLEEGIGSILVLVNLQ